MPAKNKQDHTARIVKEAVSSILEGMKPQAMLAQDVGRVLNEAVDWDELPADIPEQDFLALLVGHNMDPDLVNSFEETLIHSINDKVRDMEENDPAKYYAFTAKLQRRMTAPPLEQGKMYLETSIVPPEDESSDVHTLVAVPVVMNDDFSLMVPKKLSHGFAIGLYVTPNKEAGLSGEFNMMAHYTPAGYEIEPYVIPYKPEIEGNKNLHIVGHLDNPDGSIAKSIHEVRPFTI